MFYKFCINYQKISVISLFILIMLYNVYLIRIVLKGAAHFPFLILYKVKVRITIAAFEKQLFHGF